MIDPVNISARHNAGTSLAENKRIQPKVAAATSAVPAEKATADVSSLETKVAVADMAKIPPIDIEAVTRIKEAIAQGKYPVDLEQVADHLVESFLGSKR
jgi:negative regulator of flagellin synthesis FlgM